MPKAAWRLLDAAGAAGPRPPTPRPAPAAVRARGGVTKGSGQMSIFLSDTGGRQCVVDVPAHATGADVRREAEQALGIADAVVEWQGAAVEPHALLSDIGVCAEAVLQVRAAPCDTWAGLDGSMTASWPPRVEPAPAPKGWACGEMPAAGRGAEWRVSLRGVPRSGWTMIGVATPAAVAAAAAEGGSCVYSQAESWVFQSWNSSSGNPYAWHRGSTHASLPGWANLMPGDSTVIVRVEYDAAGTGKLLFGGCVVPKSDGGPEFADCKVPAVPEGVVLVIGSSESHTNAPLTAEIVARINL